MACATGDPESTLTIAQLAQTPVLWERHLAVDWALIPPAACLIWGGPMRATGPHRKRVLPYLDVGAQRFSMRQVMGVRGGCIASDCSSTTRISMRCRNDICLNSRHMSVTQVMPFKRPSGTEIYERTRKRARPVASTDEGTESSATFSDASNAFSMSPSCDETTNDGYGEPCAPPEAKRARTDEETGAQFG